MRRKIYLALLLALVMSQPINISAKEVAEEDAYGVESNASNQPVFLDELENEIGSSDILEEKAEVLSGSSIERSVEETSSVTPEETQFLEKKETNDGESEETSSSEFVDLEKDQVSLRKVSDSLKQPIRKGWTNNKYSVDGKDFVVGRQLIDGKYYLFNPAGELIKNSFLKIEHYTYYSDESGKAVSGFKRIDGKLFYFNPTYHFMLSNGIAEIGGISYFFREDGSILEGKGWIKDKGRFFYNASNGILTGFQKMGDKTYYFEKNGTLLKEGFTTIGNNTFYTQHNGALASGFTRIDGKLYYFNPVFFTMLKNGIAEIFGKDYLFRPDGTILEGEGWIQDGNQKYYISSKGILRGKSIVEGKTYLFTEKGELLQPGWNHNGNNDFYIQEDGSVASGFTRIDGRLYYFNPVFFTMLKNGIAEIRGIDYLFRPDGSILEGKGWVKDGDDQFFISSKGILRGKNKIEGKEYFFDQKGKLAKPGWNYLGKSTYYIHENGVIASGFTRIDGKLYYFNPVYNWMLKDGSAYINGQEFFFKKDGNIVESKGWIEDGALKYYIDSSGKLASGWREIDGKLYYFNPVYHFALQGGFAEIIGKIYYFHNDGVIARGWQDIQGKTFYFHPKEGYQFKNGTYVLEEKLRLFDENGNLVKNSGLAKVSGQFYILDEQGIVKANQTVEYQGKKYYINHNGIARLEGFTLNVPAISQRPALPTGCEITAVTMMMMTKAGPLNLVQMANEMPRAHNPSYGYVGNPFTVNGWTIYPEALEGIVRKYTGSYKNMTGASSESIKRQLVEGKPVVAWVNMHGFTVHAITLTGFNAFGYFYNDPWTGGKNIFMSYNQFNYLNSLQGYRLLSY